MNKVHCLRMHRGDDIIETIKAYTIQHDIKAGTVLSGVGCVYEAHIRDASGVRKHRLKEDMEIVSLTGTIGRYRHHLHISLSKEDMSTIGGHLLPGTYVNTTLELVLLEIENAVFDEEFDEQTGYGELVIRSETK